MPNILFMLAVIALAIRFLSSGENWALPPPAKATAAASRTLLGGRRPHRLRADRAGAWSIFVSGNWRITSEDTTA